MLCSISNHGDLMTTTSRRESGDSIPAKVRSSVSGGWFFISFGSVSLLFFLYAAVISKFLPPLKNPILAAIQNDRYYCYLVPLTLPILVTSVYFHWLSMKLFKHA